MKHLSAVLKLFDISPHFMMQYHTSDNTIVTDVVVQCFDANDNCSTKAALHILPLDNAQDFLDRVCERVHDHQKHKELLNNMLKEHQKMVVAWYNNECKSKRCCLVHEKITA